MSELEKTLLGKATEYTSCYDAALLHPFPRQIKRDELNISADPLPFFGEDVWNAYEISWLNPKGKPVVAIGEFRFPCSSPAIIESKSFKLYLNSYNQTRFESWEYAVNTMQADLSAACGAAVDVRLRSVSDWPQAVSGEQGYMLLDNLDIDVNAYSPVCDLLVCDREQKVRERLVSHLLKSNCPVTGQPDWASIQIDYTGQGISHEGLLKYIIGFREHQDFHEQCVERIFMDVLKACKPEKLTVYARYTRRGGLDINPMRTTEHTLQAENGRFVRQ